MIPSDIFEYFAETDWMKEWKARNDLELQYDGSRDEDREFWDKLENKD